MSVQTKSELTPDSAAEGAAARLARVARVIQRDHTFVDACRLVAGENAGDPITAFVVLKGDMEPTARLVRALETTWRTRLTAQERPRLIAFCDNLPDAIELCRSGPNRRA